MQMTDSAKYKDTMRGGVRGKYAKRFPRDAVMVALDPDVSAVFPDAESVNKALRVLLKAAKKGFARSLNAVLRICRIQPPSSFVRYNS